MGPAGRSFPASLADKNYCAGPGSRTNPVFGQQFLKKTSRLFAAGSSSFGEAAQAAESYRWAIRKKSSREEGPAMAETGTTDKAKSYDGFTEEERAAMKERAQELKKAPRKKASKADGEADVMAKIAEMPESDKLMAERLHAIVKEHAPELTPKTWYGMPAYAKDGKNIVFFQSSHKFKARYSTLGFEENAKLDDGAMWPTSFALTEITPEVEARIVELIKKALG